jgi:hypothetical protein
MPSFLIVKQETILVCPSLHNFICRNCSNGAARIFTCLFHSKIAGMTIEEIQEQGERPTGQDGPVDNSELGSEDGTHNGINDEEKKTKEGMTSPPQNPNTHTHSCNHHHLLFSLTLPSVDCRDAALDKLKAMCNVLGISYNSKLSEFGSKVSSERVEQCLAFLTVTRDANFEQVTTAPITSSVITQA